MKIDPHDSKMMAELNVKGKTKIIEKNMILWLGVGRNFLNRRQKGKKRFDKLEYIKIKNCLGIPWQSSG